MDKPHFFISFRSNQSHSRNLWCFFGLTLLLVFPCLLLISSSVHGAQAHGCAPDTPPPLSGNPITPQAKAGIILINEVLNNPASAWNCADPAGNYSFDTNSWVELYNPQSQPFNLYPTHTQISIDGGTNWYQVPFGTSIASNGFLVLFPDEKLPASPSWNVILTMGNTLIDSIKIPALGPDQSYARLSNGPSWSTTDQPTIDASNDIATPTSTPTSTLTSIPTATSMGTSKGTGSNGSGASTPAALGTQPAWNKVQFPPGVTPTTGAPTLADSSTPASGQSQSPPTTQNGGSNGWQIALIITLVLLLLGVLTWCWRLFRAP
jgi:hypothetical protein